APTVSGRIPSAGPGLLATPLGGAIGAGRNRLIVPDGISCAVARVMRPVASRPNNRRLIVHVSTVTPLILCARPPIDRRVSSNGEPSQFVGAVASSYLSLGKASVRIWTTACALPGPIGTI